MNSSINVLEVFASLLRTPGDGVTLMLTRADGEHHHLAIHQMLQNVKPELTPPITVSGTIGDISEGLRDGLPGFVSSRNAVLEQLKLAENAMQTAVAKHVPKAKPEKAEKATKSQTDGATAPAIADLFDAGAGGVEPTKPVTAPPQVNPRIPELQQQLEESRSKLNDVAKLMNLPSAFEADGDTIQPQFAALAFATQFNQAKTELSALVPT
jgi:PRTRC genetic system protein E